MDEAFWQERWAQGQLGFHLERVNPRLQKHWPGLARASGEPVFVPLCGKSLDMGWLAQRGHPVTGVELSGIAVKAFFEAYGHPPVVTDAGAFREYRAAGVRLLQGDFFDLHAADLPGVASVYDRASLIALPPAMRPGYARHLASLLATGTRMLLVTLEYDQREMQGPPFAVHRDEVELLFSESFVLDPLELTPELELPPRFRERGLQRMRERIYRLTRR